MKICKFCGGEMVLDPLIVTIRPGTADEYQQATLRCQDCQNAEMVITHERAITQEKKLKRVKTWLKALLITVFVLVCFLSPVQAEERRLIRVYHVFAWSIRYAQFVHVGDYRTLKEVQTKIHTIAYPLVRVRLYEPFVAKFMTVQGKSKKHERD